MTDPRHGWAVGLGTLLRTEDGGLQWVRQRLPGRASDWPLRAVSAVDEKRAVVVATEGRWLSTRDGGGVWKAPAIVPSRADSMPQWLSSVDCGQGADPRCWVVGDGVLGISPSGADPATRTWADPADLPPFSFRLGGVDLEPADADLLEGAVSRLAHRPVDWQVEAFVTSEEIRRFAEDQDPSALLDRLEARGVEVARRIESRGVPASQVEIVGAPPWGFEEHLDDDPGFVTRYWASRLASVPSVVVRAQERVALRAVTVTPTGLLAADDRGRIFEARGESGALVEVARAGPHALIALVRSSSGIVAVGRQGLAFWGEQVATGWRFVPAMELDGVGFETLRAVAFEPGGQRGWRVGDAGHLAWTEDGGRSWRAWPGRARPGTEALPVVSSLRIGGLSSPSAWAPMIR